MFNVHGICAKRDMEKNLEGKIEKHKLRNRWINNVTSNLKELEVRYWKEKTKYRKEWSVIE